MQYAEQPTPPFNSPYQAHASRSDSLLEAPYPSPSRHGPMPNTSQGLGIYNYHHQVHTTLPPSPAPSDCWSSHVSSCASPLMAHAIADPYASGAFEHPVIRSPQPWDGTQLSPRSSASPAGVTPVYSYGSESAYHELNHGMGTVSLDSQAWPNDARYTSSGPALSSTRHLPLTVAPERLSNTILAYDATYGSARLPSLDSTSGPEYSEPTSMSGFSGRGASSATNFPQVSTHPVRRTFARSRKQADNSNSAFHCVLCGKRFARSYNHKQHMETHNINRDKPHVCHYMDCQRPFVRKTDLDRHMNSVHFKRKDYFCTRCNAPYARKDTCTR